MYSLFCLFLYSGDSPVSSDITTETVAPIVTNPERIFILYGVCCEDVNNKMRDDARGVTSIQEAQVNITNQARANALEDLKNKSVSFHYSVENPHFSISEHSEPQDLINYICATFPIRKQTSQIEFISNSTTSSPLFTAYTQKEFNDRVDGGKPFSYYHHINCLRNFHSHENYNETQNIKNHFSISYTAYLDSDTDSSTTQASTEKIDPNFVNTVTEETGAKTETETESLILSADKNTQENTAHMTNTTTDAFSSQQSHVLWDNDGYSSDIGNDSSVVSNNQWSESTETVNDSDTSPLD